jgi:hypothetical protein
VTGNDELDTEATREILAEIKAEKAWMDRCAASTTVSPPQSMSELTPEQYDEARMLGALSETTPENLAWADVAEWLGLNPGSGGVSTVMTFIVLSLSFVIVLRGHGGGAADHRPL